VVAYKVVVVVVVVVVTVMLVVVVLIVVTILVISVVVALRKASIRIDGHQAEILIQELRNKKQSTAMLDNWLSKTTAETRSHATKLYPQP
jgi:predicted Holliday junction resolvase-like endonuclease